MYISDFVQTFSSEYIMSQLNSIKKSFKSIQQQGRFFC